MDNPGAFTLGDFQISAAGTYGGQPTNGQSRYPCVFGLEGMAACSLQVRFSGGAGGGEISVYIQTSLDQGQSWFDIACVEFETAPGLQIMNLTGLGIAGPTTPQNLLLPAGSTFSGPLGDRLQMVVVSTGTYPAGTLVSGRGVAR